MGNCRSSSTVTAKLILLNGKLQEYSIPVKISYLLQQNPDCFICSSDDMEFDEFVAEIGGDEVLQPGEVYFELPLEWRNQRLQAEDIAALAVKASVAFTSSSTSSAGCTISCCSWVSRKVEPMMLVFNEKERLLLAVDVGRGWVERGGVRGERRGCKGRKFTAELSAIDEE